MVNGEWSLVHSQFIIFTGIVAEKEEDFKHQGWVLVRGKEGKETAVKNKLTVR